MHSGDPLTGSRKSAFQQTIKPEESRRLKVCKRRGTSAGFATGNSKGRHFAEERVYSEKLFVAVLDDYRE